jgi:hypothetical protein
VAASLATRAPGRESGGLVDYLRAPE